ncbi:MAG: cyclic nucleotide-binding domain-containing protein [Opitutales bacterium]|nr:cyclic nucleotide-binding domain-containing protein [Opitutales bacterium]
MKFGGKSGSGLRDALDREALLREIEDLLAHHPQAVRIIRDFSEGETILGEGVQEGRIGLILEGELHLVKRSDEGEAIQVDKIGRGEMIGLLSYLAREINFIGVKAASSGRVLLLSWDAFDALLETRAEMADLLGLLMRDNLMGRYRRVVRMHFDAARLNRELEMERRELRATIAELEATRSRLINQEKLAMLGKIVAGLAHELNNPVAAIERNTAYLADLLGGMLASDEGAAASAWKAGRESPDPDSRTLRERMEGLEKKFPHLGRSACRRLAALPPELVEASAAGLTDSAACEQFLQPFEAGRFVHTLGAASERIARLVRSLKNYARPGQHTSEHVDVVAGLRDTLLILGNRFKEAELSVDLPEGLPRVSGNAGELNQIWTNLLVNASEAMGPQGRLSITARSESSYLLVRIADSGPGIAPDRIQAIFEPHFTTKAQGGQFGLGLGLSIAREIVHKHGGAIEVANASEGGAVFSVRLPVLA